MAVTAYLYQAAQQVSPRVLTTKINAAIGVSPSAVVSQGQYCYAQFADALTSDQKTLLDDFMASSSMGNAIFAATDTTPNTSILNFGCAPDLSFWRETVDNAGVITTTKVQ